MGGDLLNVSRSCTTAISRPPASTRGDTEVARGRDVALCTVEAAFQTDHTLRYALCVHVVWAF